MILSINGKAQENVETEKSFLCDPLLSLKADDIEYWIVSCTLNLIMRCLFCFSNYIFYFLINKSIFTNFLLS